MTNDDIAPLPLFSACLPDLRKAYRVGDALEITKRAVHPLADDSTASDDENLISSVARNETYCKHERALEVAAMAGEVQLLSHLSYMPLQFPTGAPFLNALITREELQRFARMKLRIELTMPAVAATALAPAAEKPVPGVVAAAKTAKATQAAEKEAREDARLAHCEAEGLVFDKDSLRPLPYGITKAAESLDPPITRQSLSPDLKAALRRRLERARNGRG